MLSKADKLEIAELVTTVIDAKLSEPLGQGNTLPEPTMPETSQGDIYYSDPMVQRIEAAKAQLVDRVARDGKLAKTIYRGRRGSYEVNESQEAMNFLNDELQNRKNFRTGRKI